MKYIVCDGISASYILANNHNRMQEIDVDAICITEHMMGIVICDVRYERTISNHNFWGVMGTCENSVKCFHTFN
jgi:hypothetical protein